VSGRVAYLDSSAFVKLVVAEPESDALRRALARWPDRASATLLRTETVRALRGVMQPPQSPVPYAGAFVTHGSGEYCYQGTSAPHTCQQLDFKLTFYFWYDGADA
jgi:hypothetical protein